RSRPGVAAAEGGVTDDRTKLFNRDGKRIGSGHAPNLAFSVNPSSDQRFNPLELTAGTWPRGPSEIAIDTGSASREHYSVGDAIGVESRGPVQRFRIAGVVKLPGVSIGGATMAVFDLPTLQHLLHKDGKLDAIRVQS